MSRRSLRRRIAYALMETGGKLLPRREGQALAKAIRQTIRAELDTHTLPTPETRAEP